ncbi:MAG: FtsW/RodA/SpoVE family cell cycle protein [Anaerolineaceae bacterium]|jgi:cell division protein FtsW
MGERAYIRPNYNTTETKRRTAAYKLPVDVPFLLIVISLLVIGLLMVYSSSWDASLLIDKPTTYVFSRQVLWIGLGILVAFFTSVFDYHKYEKYLVYMMVVMILLLLAVLIRGEVRFNSSRALVSGSIQPSELAKLAIIVYLSFWLSKREDRLAQVNVGLLPLSVILGFVGGLIFVQPDYSAAITIITLGILLFFLAGGDWKQLVIILFVGVLVGGAVVAATSTGKARLTDYFNGLQDPVMGSYHIRRTFEAIIKGRLFGVGIGQATTKFTGLPLPHTDSIFAVIAEETGLVGSFLVIALYIMLLWRGLTIAKRAPDQLGSLLSFGLISWIALEAMMNIAVIVGLLPFTGNALPFISAGGSSMVATMAAVGITMNVARQGVINSSTERSSGNAAVDLRGRDRRRGVSGADRYGEDQD